MSQTKIHYKRHLAKTITYRILGTLTTILIGIASGLPIKWASLIGLGDLLLKPIIYYLHERVWYKWVKFGVVIEKPKKTIKQKEYNEDVVVTIPPPPKVKKKTLNYTKKTN